MGGAEEETQGPQAVNGRDPVQIWEGHLGRRLQEDGNGGRFRDFICESCHTTQEMNYFERTLYGSDGSKCLQMEKPIHILVLLLLWVCHSGHPHHVADPRALPPLRFRWGINLAESTEGCELVLPVS